jgi:ankyrin repeat protein
VEALIKYADVNNEAFPWYDMYGDVSSTVPLYFAIAGVADDDENLLHHKKIVQLLVENGADTGKCDYDDERQTVFKEVLHGKHSLLAAAALSNVQAVSEHIAKGADLGARNLRGRTALLLACLSAQKLKISRRPSWTSEKKHQKKVHQAQEVAALLIEPTRAAGALDAVDNDGVSSLIVARKNGLDDIVKMLLKAGAK